MKFSLPNCDPYHSEDFVTRQAPKLAALAVVLSLIPALSACGSSSSKAGNSGAAPTTSTAAGASSAAAGGITPAALAIATQDLAPYTGHPSAFPVDVPLAAKPAAGTKLAFLQCVTPICALLAQLAQGAAQTLGVPLTVTKAGASAQSLQDAMSSIIAQKPSAVLLPASDPVQFRDEMAQLDTQKIPVVSQGIVDTEQFPAIKGVILGSTAATLAGRLLADWVVTRNGDKPSVFYNTPELTFSGLIQSGYQTQMSKLCPSCQVRYVKLPVATIGSTAPSTVTSDLQSHPDTKTAVFGTEEAADGVPPALNVAGIKVDTVGFAPDPEVLGYIKAGSITAGLGYDTLTSTWVQLDEVARLLTRQNLTSAEKADENVMQILEQKDITFDPSHGYAGYPDTPKRFAALWAGAK